MSYKHFLKNFMTLLARLVKYNLKIIFAGKFIYFLLAALFIFISVTVLNLINKDAQTNEAAVYWLLFVPGILLIFYPTTFGIQNDVDNRMIEILFGISNYRYKVWLFRLLLIFALTIAIIFLLASLSSLALVTVPVIDMVFQLVFPLIFIGSAAFMLSTITRNGSGTAVVMAIAGIVLWIPRGLFEDHKDWDLFLNPFAMPQNMNEAVWREIILNNRIYLVVGIIFTLLYGLLNLQKREKFL